ncbi:MAG: ABC transporter ATP-binding protein/permease [Lachnospiraceae bacterium]|nr:ABC transporter ATP-binding protein/permease [Lachnospiraceae bacterium]
MKDIHHKFMEEFRKIAVAKTVLLVINLICVFLSAIFLSKVPQILRGEEPKEAWRLLGMLALVFGVQLLCEFWEKAVWAVQKTRKTNCMELFLYRKILSGSLEAGQDSRLAVACGKDLAECVDYLVGTVPRIICAATGVAGISVYLLTRANGFALLCLMALIGLVQFVPSVIMEKYLVQNYIRAGEQEEALRQELVSGLAGFLTVRKLDIQDWFMKRYRKRQKEFRRAGECASLTSSVQSAMASGVLLLQQAGVLVFGAAGIALGWLPLEAVIAAYVLSGSFFGYMQEIGAARAQKGVFEAAQQRMEALEAPDGGINGYFEALQFSFPDSGMWLVKGANGAGKSTLFSILAGYRSAQETVLWKGKALSAQEREELAGWCPQTFVQSSLSFQEVSEGGKSDQRILKKCLELFEMDQALCDRPLNRLSGGEQKKFMLALTFAGPWKILLLDEPDASLDQAGRKILRMLLQEEKRPVLMAAHTQEWDDMAAGIIRVKGGQIDE